MPKAKAKFPELLRVGAHDINIVVVPRGALEGDSLAVLDYASNTIRLTAGAPWTRVLEFLCHELMHAIYADLGEGAVSYGGEAWASLIRHNPDLLRWVLGQIESE